MKHAPILLLALCAGCGFSMDAPTNNGLVGTWTAQQGEGSLTMVLTPGGANGVFGTATDTTSAAAGTVSYSVTTLPDETIRWSPAAGSGLATLDFRVRIAETCLGEPLPEAARVHDINLTLVAPQAGTAVHFVRDGPGPNCGPVVNPN
jgi:hypothetical protein